MKKKLTSLMVAAIALLPTIGLANCQEGEIVVKFSHVTNTDRHPKGLAAKLLAERINAEMDGTMCMVVYPNGSLYNDDLVFAALRRGEVQLAAPSLSKFEAYTKKLRIFDLPFLFTNIHAVEAFQASSAGKRLLDSMIDQGFQGLTYWHNGMKQMSANVPLLWPEDAKGLKIRVQPSEVIVAQMEAIGGVTQKMVLSKVRDALAEGTVEGQENTWSNIWGKKLYEVQDGVTETDHGIVSYLLVTDAEWLNSLPSDVRKQFLKIIDEVTLHRNEMAISVNNSARQAIIDSGATVRILNAKQRDAWVAIMKPVWEKFAADVGEENIRIAQKINAMISH